MVLNKMLVLRLLVVMVLLTSSCASRKQVAKDDANTEAVENVRDGTSMEKAVIVNSIDAEYEWVRKFYPGSKVMGQALINKGKKNYDLLEVRMANGKTRKVYFDIDSFFGKGF